MSEAELLVSRDHHPSIKFFRLARHIPEIKNKVLECQSLLQSQRFLTFRTLNDLEVQFLDLGAELVFHSQMVINSDWRKVFALLKGETFTSVFNPYVKDVRVLSENDDFSLFEQLLAARPSLPAQRRRFFKTFLIETGRLSVVEVHATSRLPPNEFCSQIVLISLRARGEPGDASTLMEQIVITRKNEVWAERATETMSFYTWLKLGAELLVQSRLKGDMGGDSVLQVPATPFGDKRDGCSPEQLRQLEEWRARMLREDPSLSEFPPSDFLRFLVGNRWVFPQYEQNFLKFVEFHRAKLAGKDPRTDFPELEATGMLRALGVSPKGPGVLLFRFARCPEVVDIDRFSVFFILKMMEAVRMSAPSVQEYIIFVDMDGFKRDTFPISTLKTLSNTFGSRFPEVQSKNIVINLGTLASLTIKAVRVFLEETANQKLVTIGCDKAEIRAAFFEFLPPRMVPKAYGGSADSD